MEVTRGKGGGAGSNRIGLDRAGLEKVDNLAGSNHGSGQIT